MATNFRESYIPSMKAADKSIGRAVLLIVISSLSFGSISVLTVLVTSQQVPLITAMDGSTFFSAVYVRHSRSVYPSGLTA